MEIKKVLLINPHPYYAKEINEKLCYPPLGLAYLASILKKENIDCEILDAHILKYNNKQILDKISDYNPDLIGLTSNISTVREVIELTNEIKTKFNKFVIIGGCYASSSFDYILKNSKADYVIKGEGEAVIKELIKKDEFKKVNGVAFLHNNKIISNPNMPLIKNIDALPFPAYDMITNFKSYHARSRKRPQGFILTGRGCPFQCIYCDKSVFGRDLRLRSPKNVIEEIKFLIDNYEVKQIDIVDDNFTFDIKRAEKIFDLIIKNKFDILINFPNGIRAEKLNACLVKKMKKAGVYKVAIGIESGDEAILKSIKKSLKLNDVIKAVDLFKKENILVSGFFMLGLPGENEKTMQKTINLAKELNPHIANFALVVPFPGTELHDIIKEKGKFNFDIKKGLESGYYTIKEGYYELGDLKKEVILKYQKKAYKEFYIRPKKIFELLSNLKSYDEFEWLTSTSWPFLKGAFKHKKMIE